MYDTRPVHPLRGHGREAVREVEAHLVAENGDGPSTGPVALLLSLAEDATQEIEILLHRLSDLCVGSPSRMRQRFH